MDELIEKKKDEMADLVKKHQAITTAYQKQAGEIGAEILRLEGEIRLAEELKKAEKPPEPPKA